MRDPKYKGKKGRKKERHNQMHKGYNTRERLKKLTTDSVNETLGRTSIPIVSCSCRVSISVCHALFDMYDRNPTTCPREYPARITKNWMREEAMPCSMSGNRSRTCFWARCGCQKKGKKEIDQLIVEVVEWWSGGAMPTYPVTSDLVRSDQLAIQTEIRSLCRRACCCLVGSCRVAAVCCGTGGCICGGVVGLGHGG